VNNSLKCCEEKWRIQGDIYFDTKAKFESYQVFIESNISEECFTLVYDKKANFPEHLKLSDYFLVECIEYEDGYLSLVVIKRTGAKIDLITTGQIQDKIKGISILVTCTDDDIYRPFLLDNFPKYHRTGLELDLNVVFYGNHPLNQIKNYANILRKPREEFRNFHNAEKVNICKYDHVLLSDVDIYYPPNVINSIIDIYESMPNMGIINLRHFKTVELGNGQYFGRKDVIIKNFGDKFKGFWFKDTEYLMNLSRTGIIPLTFFVPFERGSHVRHTKFGSDGKWFERNKKIFTEVMKHGR